MFFNSFWKRLLILNIGILIVLFRIYVVIEKYFKKHSSTNSLFPVLTDDGYPFFNAINCDLKKLTTITKSIIDNKSNNNKFLIPNELLTSKECFFMNKHILCKNNEECLDKINRKDQVLYSNKAIDESFLENNYHSKIMNNKINDIIGISSLINIMNNRNEFIDNKKNKVEISFYNKIVSGYYSFLFIKQYDNNIKNNIHTEDGDFTNYHILKQITKSENRLNDLFYLYSLMLHSYSKYSNSKSVNETDSNYYLLYLNFANECIELNDDLFALTKNKIIPINKKIFEEIFLNQINGLFNCLNDINEKNSFNIDFTAINSMIKILSGDKNISNYEYNSMHLLLIELSQMINNIFNAEIHLNNVIGILRQNYLYILIIFGFSCLAIIFLINKHFMKNKNIYENKRKRKEIISQQKYGINNTEKKKEFVKYENKTNDKKLTNEELEFVQKLAKENKADFLITK